ncbi:glycosyltransferase family 39 protein [Zwartia vadi]|uniref:glycosyltransferase family 39 protein n=1 Tax=Zwartia vadi TaxID=3058168 RepID=UPI0025B33259|nr:glycosyltransferase family 39 protein [Zwartia vadi]MDN3986900.1 glycosyltransferase family 39 protein [Zwartia vadi]
MQNYDARSATTTAIASRLSLKTLLALGLIIHFGFGFLLTLSVDEAHYVLYAAKPDWSYFDHPPLVGWIQWPLVAAGAPDFVIRLIPQLLWLAACLLARQLALRLYDLKLGHSTVNAQNSIANAAGPSSTLRTSVGLWAVGLVLLAPVMHVLAVGLLPDSLLMVLVLLLMSVTLSLAQSQIPTKKNPREWLLWLTLGVLLGLAGLSKYTAILPAIAVIVTLLLARGLRVLAAPGPWVAALVALILISPVLYWNAQHEWISFVYQLKHGSGGAWKARRLAAFVGIQLVAYGPLLIMGAYLATRQIIQSKNWVLAALLLFFLIPFLVTGLMSGGGGSLPHWTAPAWLAITPFAANALAQRWESGRHALILAFIRTQTVICLVAFAALFFVGVPGLSQDHALVRKNPLADLWGWDEAGLKARELASSHNLDSLSVRNWTLGSRLAWYARPLPVYVLDNRFDQFDLWFGKIPPGSDSLFVNWSQVKFDLPTKAGEFEACSLIGTFESKRFNRHVSRFDFYHCRHWGATPTTK